MGDKSYVSLEQQVCLVCGSAFDTGAILLNKHLRATMERHTKTGFGLCAEDQERFAAGYVALVECDPQKSGVAASATRVQPEQAYRTGRIAHLRREVFSNVFNVPIPSNQPLVFIEPGVIERLQAMEAPAAG